MPAEQIFQYDNSKVFIFNWHKVNANATSDDLVVTLYILKSSEWSFMYVNPIWDFLCISCPQMLKSDTRIIMTEFQTLWTTETKPGHCGISKIQNAFCGFKVT